MSSLNRLEEFEMEEYEENQEEIKERFKILGLGEANWALRKIQVCKKEQNEIDNLAKIEISRINEWAEKEKNKFNMSIQFFEGLLTEYLMNNREFDKKFKVSTPYGSVGTRKQQPKWNINEEVLIKWLKENEKIDLIRTKEEPALSEMKKVFSIVNGRAIDAMTGEIVEGISILQQSEKVVIKTNA